MQNLKKHKKTLFVRKIVLTALVNMSVFFSAFLIFAVFGISSFFFSEMFLIGFQKSKNTKYQRNKKTTTTTTNKKTKDAKQKQMKYYESKQNKTTSRK